MKLIWQPYGVYLYLSKIEFHPTLIPTLENLTPGISNIFSTLLFTRHIQRKKSIGFSLPRLKTQVPFCSETTGLPRLRLRLPSSTDFTSMLKPFQSKSGPLPLKRSNFALSNFAAYFSQYNPFPVSVFQNSLLPLQYELGWCLTHHARFTHCLEQYFIRAFRFLQKSHFIMPSVTLKIT